MERLITGPRVAIAALFATVLALALPAIASAQPGATAKPTGGTVVAGAATISQTPTTTTVSQSSNYAAVDWQGFDLGSQQEVLVQQPSASALTIMRVTGAGPSRLAGRIDATGTVVIVNVSGTDVYRGAQLNAAGLVISAAGISNQNLKNDRTSFDVPANPGATVQTAGAITVKQAGILAIVAPHVVGGGTMSARLGSVYLLGAETATLDLYADRSAALTPGDQVTQAPAGATSLVAVPGQVHAEGGLVDIEGRAAGGIVQTLVDVSGTIATATQATDTGEIRISGTGGGAVVTGSLGARGAAPGTTGGKIGVETSGPVTLEGSAVLNTAGEAGGGVIAVGTTLVRASGGPTVKGQPTSSKVTVASPVKLNADALADGDGGRVTVLASGTNDFGGKIVATGGPGGGNGGFVEISGQTVWLTGSVDTSAPVGKAGTLLLDPVRFTCRLRRWDSPTPPPAGCVRVH